MILILILSFSFPDLKDDLSNFWNSLNKIGGFSGFEILEVDLDAPMNSMAGNYWDKGVHALLFNPAEIIQSESSSSFKSEATFTHRILGCSMNAEFLGFTKPIWCGTVGLSFLGFFSGDMELRRNIPGNPVGNYSAEDLIGGLSYARNLGNNSLGGTIRFLNERIFTGSYSTYSFDLGISHNFSIPKIEALRMDISFLHLGPKYTNYKFRLPLTWHLGLKGNFGSFRGGFSLNKPLNTKTQWTIGGEYKIRWFAIRVGSKRVGAGKNSENFLEKYYVGFGLHKNRFYFDYSYSPNDNGYEGSHLFTASLEI